MNLQIDEPIYRWLFTLNLLPTQVRKLKNGKVEIPLTNTTQLETGTLILKLIQTINTQQSLNQKLPSLSALKLHATAGDKLYNWSLLADILKGFGFILNEEMKRLIISGNTAILNDILKELFDFFNGRNPKINKKNPKVEASALINSSVSKSLITNQSIIMDKNMIVSPKECIDLANIDIQKPLELTESLLEFLVVGVSRNLNLKANQVPLNSLIFIYFL